MLKYRKTWNTFLIIGYTIWQILIRNMLQLNQCKLYLLYVLHITIFGRFHHNVHLIVKYYNVQFMYLFIKVTIVIPFLLQIQIVVPFTLHITFLCFPYYEIRLLYTVTIRIVARFWLQITTTISWPHCPFSWWAGSVFWLAWWSWLFSLAVSRTRSSVGWLSYSCYLEVNIIIQKANLFISLIFAKDH